MSEEKKKYGAWKKQTSKGEVINFEFVKDGTKGWKI